MDCSGLVDALKVIVTLVDDNEVWLVLISDDNLFPSLWTVETIGVESWTRRIRISSRGRSLSHG